MNYIKPISEFLSEAISMKMYKENLPKELWYDKSDGYKKWDNIFGKGVNRITIPLKSDSIKLPTSTTLMEEVNSIFIPLGYKINSFEDYLNNKVYKIGDTKNPMKIGGLLNKTNPDLFGIFDTSTERKEWKDRINNSNKELKIIISRHPYDLLGMSSGRDWKDSSCMRLGTSNDKVYKLLGFDENESTGQYKNKIKKDIEYGVLVAYVVKSDDNNINKPLSRLLIKPYVNNNNDETDILWVSADKLYGKNVGGFKSSVDEWLGTWQGDDFNGLYCIKNDLYADGKESIRIYKPIDKWTDKDRKNFLNQVVYDGNWTLNSDGEVDVDGNVFIKSQELTEIPVKFGKVSGGFYCYTNKLTSLQGCPMIVGWDFYCSNNQLTSLEFAPTSLVGDFSCSSNQLTSLEFAPTSVGGNFNCSSNQLTSLEFAPTFVSGYFDCSSNQLTSLEFAPTSVDGGDFSCSSNKLTSLEFAPTSVIGSFYCYNNQLTSLEFAPTSVGGNFNCYNNQLTSLEFAPTSVDGDFSCYNQKNGHKFTEEDVRAVCQVEHKVYV